MKITNPFTLLLLLFLGGCSYQAGVDVSPAYDVYTSYDDKIDGNWALLVQADALEHAEYKFDGFTCSAHTYPMDLSVAFRPSAVKTIENVVANLQLVDQPLTRQNMLDDDYHGIIVIRGEDVDVDMDVIPGFWTSEVEAEVELAVSITVEGHEGRLLGTTVSEDGKEQTELGSFCEGGANALGEASSEAIRNVLERVAERLANAPKVRDYAL